MDALQTLLETLTDSELVKVERRLFKAIGDGGHFGWDWPTLYATHPEKATVIEAVRTVIRARGVKP